MNTTKTQPTGSLRRMVGKRVEIVCGAWSGETGTVREWLETNGALRVRLDNGFQAAWFASELRELPNDPSSPTAVGGKEQ